MNEDLEIPKKMGSQTDVKLQHVPENQASSLSFEEYISELKKSVDSIDKEKVNQAIDILFEAHAAGKAVYLIGNGGSMVNAEHMALHLENASGILVYDNSKDQRRVGFARVGVVSPSLFIDSHERSGKGPLPEEQFFTAGLKGRVNSGDILIAISGSGSSPNILDALKYGKDNGAKTIGLLGFKTGGKSAELVDCPIIIDSNNYGPIEDAHAALVHMITGGLERRVREQSIEKGVKQ